MPHIGKIVTFGPLFSTPAGLGFTSPNSYLLDGVDEHLEWTDNASFSSIFHGTGKTFWISVVFRPQTTGANQILFGQWMNPSSRAVLCTYTSGDQLRMSTSSDGVSVSSATTVATFTDTSVFYHAVFVYNAGTVNIYVDGVDESLTGSVDGTIANISIAYRIGQHSSGNYLNAYVNHLGIGNTAITAGDVTSFYNSGKPTAPALVPGAQHTYIFDSDTFSTQWSVIDGKGSENGDSINMELGDRVLVSPY